jgi:hypothetical protein
MVEITFVNRKGAKMFSLNVPQSTSVKDLTE